MVSNSEELYSCKADLTSREDVVAVQPNGELKLNLVWTDKTRGKLRIFSDRFSFKNLFTKAEEIPYHDIKLALLISSQVAFMRVCVLWLEHKAGRNALGFRHHPFWEGELPFKVLRENAGYSKMDLLKKLAGSAASGLVGEAAEGLSGTSPLTGSLVNTAASEMSGSAMDKAGEKLSRKKQKQTEAESAPPPLYVIRRGNKQSQPMNRDALIQRIKAGKVRPDDRVIDLNQNKPLPIKILLDRYAP